MEHKIALVTGASSGIGEQLCSKLVKEGIKLVICGRNESRLKALENHLPAGAVLKIIIADLLHREERDQVIAAIREYDTDLVINNAGYAKFGNALTYTTQEQLAILEVDGAAVLEITLETARLLRTKRKQGVILNVSSVASFYTWPDFAIYTASKAFINAFSQSLNIEFEPFGIHVLVSCPGAVDTEFFNRAGSITDSKNKFPVLTTKKVVDQIWEQIKRLQPLSVIDWRYRISLIISRFLPKRWFALKLQKNIQNRIDPRKFIDSE